MADKITKLTKLLALLGGAWLTHRTFDVLKFIYTYTRPSSLHKYLHNPRNEPSWALVTGASDGIGLQFAAELARRGFHVVLHGRNPAKLEAKRAELAAQFPRTSFRTVTADASLSGDALTAQLTPLVDSLRDVRLTVLVNNVGGLPAGVGANAYATLDENPAADIDGYLHINALFPCRLTAAVLPLLVRDDGPGLVLNISSFASVGLPCMVPYSASKAFVDVWTVALQREMRLAGRNIEVLDIQTRRVTSVSHNKEKPSFAMPDAATYVRGSLDRVGCGEYIVDGYWGHGILNSIVSLVPEFLFSRELERNLRDLSGKDFKRK